MLKISKILLVSIGSSESIDTWSGVPYFLRKSLLEKKQQQNTWSREEELEYSEFFRGEEPVDFEDLYDKYKKLAEQKQAVYEAQGGEEFYKEKTELEGISDALTVVNEQINNFNSTEIKDTIFKSIEDSLDSVISKTELLNSVTGKIGEGFTMAAEDVVTFSSVYPELFEGMEAGEDGLMKLNQQAVENFIQVFLIKTSA